MEQRSLSSRKISGKILVRHAKYQLVNLLDLLNRCLESTVRVKDAPVNKRLENYEKIKIETEGWPHSKEHKKRLIHHKNIRFINKQ